MSITAFFFGLPFMIAGMSKSPGIRKKNADIFRSVAVEEEQVRNDRGNKCIA